MNGWVAEFPCMKANEAKVNALVVLFSIEP